MHKHFVLCLPPKEDDRFVQVANHLMNTLMRESTKLRVRYAIEHSISPFDVDIKTERRDPERPNVITLVACPREIKLFATPDD